MMVICPKLGPFPAKKFLSSVIPGLGGEVGRYPRLLKYAKPQTIDS